MKILLLRNMGDHININNYNVQEIGLAKALAKRGHTCDIVLYSKSIKYKKEIIRNYCNNITIHWVKGLNIYSNAIFLKLIKEKFFDGYDIIQTHEYNQVMTYILSYVTKTKKIIYHGPYEDIKNKTIHKLYDFIFLPGIRRSYNHVLAKSKLSEEYLLQKGFSEVQSIGVGLDPQKFLNSISFEKSSLYKYKIRLQTKPTLLYIGKIEKRRNIMFLLQILYELKKQMEFNFILIGDGEEQYKSMCFEKIKELGLNDTIIYFEKIGQNEIRYAYENSDLFLFPTKYEIFGMVLLESMFFNCPILSSFNGGSSVLLQDKYPEMVIKNYDEKEWVKRIKFILNNNKNYQLKEYIEKNFVWDVVSEKFENKYKEVLAN